MTTDRSTPPPSPVAASALGPAGSTTAALERALGPRLVAVYLHGSAVLGGYRPDGSDLDVLAIADDRIEDADIDAVVAALHGGRYPARGLELSIVTRDEAARPDLSAPRFQLHVTLGNLAKSTRVVDGRGREGDGDLVLHFAVCRAAGMALLGPPRGDTIAAVPETRIRLAMLDEIEWAATAPPEYLVLTAARAWLFAETGRLASKVEAGAWAEPRDPDPVVIAAALTFQHGGRDAIDPLAAASFARRATQRLHGR